MEGAEHGYKTTIVSWKSKFILHLFYVCIGGWRRAAVRRPPVGVCSLFLTIWVLGFKLSLGSDFLHPLRHHASPTVVSLYWENIWSWHFRESWLLGLKLMAITKIKITLALAWCPGLFEAHIIKQGSQLHIVFLIDLPC